MFSPPLSVRVPFVQPDDPELLLKLLRETDMEVTRERDGDLSTSVELASLDRDYPATLTLNRFHDVADVGCAFFSGPARFDLAMALIPCLLYMPVELLHLDARTHPDPMRRLVALRVLGDVYLAEEDVSFWNPVIDATLRMARQDANHEVRQVAAFAELSGNPGAAREHVREMLKVECNLDAKRDLGVILRMAEASPAEAVVVPEEIVPFSPRFAFPACWMESLDTLVTTLDPTCIHEGTQRSPLDPDVGMASFRIRGTKQARMDFVLHHKLHVGCAYFTGPDSALLATILSPALHYLPLDLARDVIRYGQHTHLRGVALFAIAMAASERILPGNGVAPETQAVLAEALEDPEPAIRDVAYRASLLIRDELARTVAAGST